mmetsp:Transcript_1620/g.2893  ORF Transcript_1620/g.2893 Transcript_1620/m.2893 type:complete len:123 (-) Transcript_1620:224-592(-)
MPLIPQYVQFFFLPSGVLIFAWFVPSTLHWLDRGNFRCALRELMDVFEKENKIGQNEELRLLFQESRNLVSQNQQQRIIHYKYFPKDSRERKLSKEPIDKLLADEERDMEKCKLGMTQISKC